MKRKVMLPIWARKISCRCFDWMLQSSSGQREAVSTNAVIYSHVLLTIRVTGGQRSIPTNYCSHFFTFGLMMTGAFSRNVSKLFSKLKLVTDGFPLRFSHCLDKREESVDIGSHTKLYAKGGIYKHVCRLSLQWIWNTCAQWGRINIIDLHRTMECRGVWASKLIPRP